HADATVAVFLGGERREPEDGVMVVETAEEQPVEEWFDRFRRSASQLLESDLVRSLTSRFGRGGDGAAAEGERSAGEPRPEGSGGELAEPAGEGDDDPFEPLPAGLGKFDVMYQSLDVLQSVLARYRLAGYPPDVLVSVPKDAARGLDFHKAEELIALGRELTAEALDQAGLTGAPVGDVEEVEDVDDVEEVEEALSPPGAPPAGAAGR